MGGPSGRACPGGVVGGPPGAAGSWLWLCIPETLSGSERPREALCPWHEASSEKEVQP